MQQAVLHHINQLYYIITMQQPNCFSSEVFSLVVDFSYLHRVIVIIVLLCIGFISTYNYPFFK